ncbi:hypothetical protein F183_A30820 [Bryobacterales bacterium F-183]|nr:hypothetical protein F183_A30820 [Bryobacterales bacterium F-183]
MLLQSLFLLVLAGAGDDPKVASDAKARAEAMHEQGFQLFNKGEGKAAAQAVFASLAMHRKLGLREEQAINLRLLAVIHDGMGERQKSIGFYNEALRLARAVGNQRLEANTLRDLGVLYYNIDDNERAFRYLESALVLQRKIAQPKGLGQTLFGLGEMRRTWNQKDKARANYEEALPLATESGDLHTQADVLGALAALDPAAGRAYIDRALAIRQQIGEPRGEASTRLKLAAHYQAIGNKADALNEYRTAVQLFEKAKYRGGEAFARQSLAFALRDTGDLDGAIEEMFRAVDLAEGLRQKLSDRDLRATYIGYVQNRYEFLIDALVDRKEYGRALEVSERARARALVESLRDAGVTTNAAASLRAKDIQQNVLDAQTTLIEFALGAKRSHMFILRRDGIAYRELPARPIIEAEARKIYEAYRTPAATLSRKKPDFLPELPNTGNLLIVADGALHYLPFAHLTAAPITIAPSASAIAATRSNQPTKPASITVIADPDVPQLPRLPFARMEADAILSAVPKDMQTFRAVGRDATLDAVRKHPASILHIAAHGLLDTSQPERSELALSGGGLKLRDLYGVRQSSSLVVLSACQTALGKEMKREGLIGLAWGFQQAGADRVLASLWKVDDRATAELMKHFYVALLQNGKPAPVALRDAQAQLAASRRWSDPFYWAGFVLQGDWR